MGVIDLKRKKGSAPVSRALIRRPLRRWFPLFMGPVVCAFIIGFVYPFCKGVYLSFCKFKTTSDAEFIGLGNYVKALQDASFMHSFWYTGLFALVSLYTSTKTMDSVIKGFNTAMQFLIISARQEEIIRRIHTELERGCTRLEATGTYEGRKNGTLLCVVSRMEASRLKKIVSECDPHAFVTVCDVHEALGEGFSYHQHTA